MPRRLTAKKSRCQVLLDRLQLLAWPGVQKRLPTFNGFRLVWDRFVHRQTTTTTYTRCCAYDALQSRTKMYLQREPRAPWLAPWKVTFVADDSTGLLRSHIEEVIRNCDRYQLLMVELAFDFTAGCGIDKEFVKRHATFGKSRRNKRTPHFVFGSRKSTKRAHCYAKPEMGVFRVEVQLNSRLLRSNYLLTINDLRRTGTVLFPQHLHFVRVAWEPLRHYLVARFGRTRGEHIFNAAQAREQSLQSVLRYLRHKRIANTHRFLRPIRVNKKVRAAVKKWITEFMES